MEEKSDTKTVTIVVIVFIACILVGAILLKEGYGSGTGCSGYDSQCELLENVGGF